MSMSCLQAALRAGVYALHDVDWRTIEIGVFGRKKQKTREEGKKKKSNKCIQQTPRNAQNQP